MEFELYMKSTKIVLASLLVLLTVLLFSSPAKGIGAYGTATMDGTISPGEWTGAASASFDLGGGYTGTLLVMNDATNLYLAVTVADDSLQVGAGFPDRVEFQFNNDNDANGPMAEIGDDELYGFGDYFADRFAPAPLSSAGDNQVPYTGTVDGSGAGTHVSGPTEINHFELSHPLDSADNDHDFSLHFGDTVGFRMHYYDGGGSVPGAYAPLTFTGAIDILSGVKPPSNPYHYVGGELFSANKLAVLSPYLAFFTIVAVAAVVVKRKLT